MLVQYENRHESVGLHASICFHPLYYPNLTENIHQITPHYNNNGVHEKTNNNLILSISFSTASPTYYTI